MPITVFWHQRHDGNPAHAGLWTLVCDLLIDRLDDVPTGKAGLGVTRSTS